MLVLRIEYLTGRCVATEYNDRNEAEWPPHPARVYSALVAAWAESEDPAERNALEWLAAQPPPAIHASEASARTMMSHFVPVNDTSVLRGFESQQQKLANTREALAAAEQEISVTRDAKISTRLTQQTDKLRKDIAKQVARLADLQMKDQQPEGKVTAKALEEANHLLPDHRSKQARTFPSVSPHEPVVFLAWPIQAPREHLEPLYRLAGRVPRIGHSSSFVACRFVEEPVDPPALVPDDDGDQVLRVPGPGQLDRLVEAWQRHREIEPRVLPCRFQRYGEPHDGRKGPIAHSVFDIDWIVFRRAGGPRYSATLTQELTQALRGALLCHATDPPPEILSGHDANGSPAQSPHVAAIALPDVGHTHAGGHILGLALVLPRELSGDDRRALLAAIGRWEAHQREKEGDPEIETPCLRLLLGARGEQEIQRVLPGDFGRVPRGIRSTTWTRPSSRWLTVTPICLDRNPGDLRSKNLEKAAAAFASAEETIATSCERIGLPRPIHVEILPSVTMPGVAKSRDYPPFPSDPGKTRRVKVHAFLQFEARVRGPVLLGAGRYYGLGLCRPVSDREVPS